jgi:hypothetical protein
MHRGMSPPTGPPIFKDLTFFRSVRVSTHDLHTCVHTFYSYMHACIHACLHACTRILTCIFFLLFSRTSYLHRHESFPMKADEVKCLIECAGGTCVTKLKGAPAKTRVLASKPPTEKDAKNLQTHTMDWLKACVFKSKLC